MNHELRILLLEDSPQDAEFVRRELQRAGVSFDTRHVDTRKAFVEQIDVFQPNLIISDYLLPSFDGLTALALVRERFPELPFILVSGYIGEERATEAMKSGATDFLLKSSLSSRLVPAVQRAMREVKERAERNRTEQMLRQAQKMEAVGQLTGGVAHDFNNLLTVIMGNLDLLQASGGRSPAEQQRIDDAIAAAERGTELTRRLLAFSRRQVLRPRQADLNAVVAGMQTLLRRTLDESIDIKLALTDELWPVRVDVAMLESALLNIAINARDAMPHGGALTIETANRILDEDYAAQRTEVAPGPYAMLAVSDTGSGMPPEVLARAFEPFFTTKEVGKGTGLGLSMVFGFVKQSGGHIAIYSEEGHGTTLRIYLTRAADGALEAPAIQPDRATAPAGSETILVVEDDASVRATAINILSSLGYRVLDAPDGPSALALLDRHPEIDLMLTDVVMPSGMKGPALVRAALERLPRLKVLYMSGYAENAIGHGGVLDAGVDWIDKPFQRLALGQKVREVLDRTPAP